MLIRILRSTMAAPKNEPVRAVDAGEVIDVEPMVALRLCAMGKAEPVAPTPPNIETPEDALTETEIRPALTPEPKKGKRR